MVETVNFSFLANNYTEPNGMGSVSPDSATDSLSPAAVTGARLNTYPRGSTWGRTQPVAGSRSRALPGGEQGLRAHCTSWKHHPGWDGLILGGWNLLCLALPLLHNVAWGF